MVRKCCVPDCASNYSSALKNGTPATSTFQFPDDPVLSDRWVKAIRRPNWIPSKRTSVCIHHFKPDDIVKYEKPAKLKPDAVPCLFGAVLQGRSAVPAQRGRPRKVKKPTRNGDNLSDRVEQDTISTDLDTISSADHVIEDCILSFENFKANVRDKLQQSEWMIFAKQAVVHLFSLDDGDERLPIRIDISLKVYSDLTIKLFIRDEEQTASQLRWILGMDNKLLRWSQLVTIVEKYGDTSRHASEADRTKGHDEERNGLEHEEGKCEPTLEEEHLDDELVKPSVSDESLQENESTHAVAGQTILLEIEEHSERNFIDIGTADSIASEDSLDESAPKGNDDDEESCEPFISRRTPNTSLALELRRKFKCFICNQDEGSRDKFEQHMPTHLSMVPYHCTLCTKENVTIKTLASLNKHMLMHRKPLKCRFCDVRFITYTARSMHENSKHNNLSTTFECGECHKSFSSHRSYRYHRKIHDDPESLKCVLCDRILSTGYELKLHMRTHTGEKPNKCTFCTMAFNRRSNLTEHIRRFHSMERPFDCSVCGARFRTNLTLKKHELSHDPCRISAPGGKPKRVSRSSKVLHCSDCDRQFESHVSYNSHRRQHNKRYQCSYCGLRVAQLRDFEDHMNIHTGARPYKCKTCDKTFRSASTYYGHLLVHGGEKKHVCQICNRGFMRITHLQVHMRTHLGEKPFRCETCGQRYANKSTYKRHQQTHRPTVGDMLRAKQLACSIGPTAQDRQHHVNGGLKGNAMLSSSAGEQIVHQMEMVFPAAQLLPLEEEGMDGMPSIMSGVLDSECSTVLTYLVEDSYMTDLPHMIRPDEGTLTSVEFQ